MDTESDKKHSRETGVKAFAKHVTLNQSRDKKLKPVGKETRRVGKGRTSHAPVHSST